jgi:NAD+ kinase
MPILHGVFARGLTLRKICRFGNIGPAGSAPARVSRRPGPQEWRRPTQALYSAARHQIPRGVMNPPRFAFVAADTDDAQQALISLEARYESVSLDEADVIVALGGDGFMLETLHDTIERGVPIYGMNCGTVGFLMNQFADTGPPERLARAERVVLYPLRMEARCVDGKTVQALAINEVSLLRESRQAGILKISVDGVVRIEEMVCDGILVATPAGSTAYNLSARGSIVPIGAPLLALTPISAFRPRHWRGALLPNSAEVEIEVLNPRKRPVSATADYTEVRDVVRVRVHEDRSISLSLLFDPEHNLEKRIIQEQFLP